jgi:hypothetical protein
MARGRHARQVFPRRQGDPSTATVSVLQAVRRASDHVDAAVKVLGTPHARPRPVGSHADGPPMARARTGSTQQAPR